jgi:predicted HAD superfamily phosphohydrolase YqeG
VAKIIFVDVDDTLIRSVGSKRIPMVRAIEQVKALHLAGNTLYLWSSGGANYARESAVELGIDLLFEAFLPKPNVYIDDQEVHEWRTCKHVLPGQDLK